MDWGRLVGFDCSLATFFDTARAVGRLSGPGATVMMSFDVEPNRPMDIHLNQTYLGGQSMAARRSLRAERKLHRT